MTARYPLPLRSRIASAPCAARGTDAPSDLGREYDAIINANAMLDAFARIPQDKMHLKCAGTVRRASIG